LYPFFTLVEEKHEKYGQRQDDAHRLQQRVHVKLIEQAVDQVDGHKSHYNGHRLVTPPQLGTNQHHGNQGRAAPMHEGGAQSPDDPDQPTGITVLVDIQAVFHQGKTGTNRKPIHSRIDEKAGFLLGQQQKNKGSFEEFFDGRSQVAGIIIEKHTAYTYDARIHHIRQTSTDKPPDKCQQEPVSAYEFEAIQ